MTRREWWIWRGRDSDPSETYAVLIGPGDHILSAWGPVARYSHNKPRPWSSILVTLPRQQDGHGRRLPGPCPKVPLDSLLSTASQILDTLHRRREEFLRLPAMG